MSDDITLTLKPTPVTGAPGAPGAPTAASFTDLQAQTPADPEAYAKAVEQLANLSPEEQQKVDEFANQIDITNSSVILQYGAGAQTKMGEFSQTALNGVRTKDMGEIGKMVTGLVTELKGFDASSEKGGGFLGLFKKGGNRVAAIKAKYATAEKNVETIAGVLETHQHTLMKDVAMLDKMYEQNVLYFKELTMYVLAGKKKLSDAEQTELPALRDKAKQSGLPEDAQAANDFANQIDRFSKKLHDLELTRTISLQMAPQIRMIQNNDTLMTEKIQSTLVNTIPLWKSQMVLALGVQHSQQAAQAQREVSDMTNELLKKNSETLKMATIETAKESERGIVDIETLQLTNRNLIETLDEVVQIQTAGRQRRNEAEVELARIEGELKDELLKLRG
jgi:uncharacterized protein YaaN involved in tellurite resistance